MLGPSFLAWIQAEVFNTHRSTGESRNVQRQMHKYEALDENMTFSFNTQLFDVFLPAHIPTPFLRSYTL